MLVGILYGARLRLVGNKFKRELLKMANERRFEIDKVEGTKVMDEQGVLEFARHYAELLNNELYENEPEYIVTDLGSAQFVLEVVNMPFEEIE